jgi:hypothetical protein
MLLQQVDLRLVEAVHRPVQQLFAVGYIRPFGSARFREQLQSCDARLIGRGIDERRELIGSGVALTSPPAAMSRSISLGSCQCVASLRSFFEFSPWKAGTRS